MAVRKMGLYVAPPGFFGSGLWEAKSGPARKVMQISSISSRSEPGEWLSWPSCAFPYTRFHKPPVSDLPKDQLRRRTAVQAVVATWRGALAASTSFKGGWADHRFVATCSRSHIDSKSTPPCSSHVGMLATHLALLFARRRACRSLFMRRASLPTIAGPSWRPPPPIVPRASHAQRPQPAAESG